MTNQIDDDTGQARESGAVPANEQRRPAEAKAPARRPRRRNMRMRDSDAPAVADTSEQTEKAGQDTVRSERGRRRSATAADAQEKKPAKSRISANRKNDQNPKKEQPDATASPLTEAEAPSVAVELQAPKRSRRGKRGGKKKTGSQAGPPPDVAPHTVVATLVAQAVCRFPALPQARGEEKAVTAAERNNRIKSPARDAARQLQPKKRMFISVIPGEQVEVGLTENGTLLEYYLDMLHQRKLKGNIYRGIIHNIDTNLQAAFVDFGVGKNGFLQIDEVHPEYWQGVAPDPAEKRKFPPIQKVLHPGQELLVQVVKEASGNKGAFLTTWVSLAGRFLVLTPGQEQVGVSRKVTDAEERSRLRDMMNGLSPGADLGVIVRTVGEGATKTTLKNDLQYLKRLWRDIRKKAAKVSAPALIHQEPGLSERSVRDYLTEDVTEIWVDNAEEAERVRTMAALLFPRKKDLVHIYESPGQSVWEHFNLRQQLEQIYAREVPLPSGGRLVFDQTEALMAIDINSGKISGKGNFEAMAFKTNMEASQTIARQLRLRDIGGQVVIDFIEMREKKHVQEVEKTLRQAMKSDRARHDISGISSFGLLELVRQRMGSSALALSTEPCAACGGTGSRRSLEWQALQALRDLAHKLKHATVERFVCEYPKELGLYLLNHKREALRNLENSFNKSLEIKIQY